MRDSEAAEKFKWGPLSLPPALGYPAFRAFWLGSVASVAGFQILRFAQFWLIFELTGSPLNLGYVGLANGLPAIFLNLFGGLAADRMDQRRLIMVSQTITASLVFLLATITLLDMVSVWHLLTISFLAGAVESFDQPARRSLFPHLIDRRVMASAVALNSSMWPANRIMAPAVAGFIISLGGTQSAFYVAGAGFLVLVAVTYFLRVPQIRRSASAGAAHDLLEGLKYIASNSIFSFIIAMTFFNSFFGGAYITLMPMFALEILKVGAGGQGLLMSVGGVGSLITSLWLASRGGERPMRLLIIGGGIMSGVAVGAFGLTSEYLGYFWLAMVLMFAIGVFNTMFTTSSQTALQLMVPDEIRGRVMGFYGMTYNIRPLGGMQAGALANVGALGAHWAVAIGGIAVVIFALGAAIFNRNVRKLDTLLAESTAPAEAEAQREQASPSNADS